MFVFARRDPNSLFLVCWLLLLSVPLGELLLWCVVEDVQLAKLSITVGWGGLRLLANSSLPPGTSVQCLPDMASDPSQRAHIPTVASLLIQCTLHHLYPLLPHI